MVDRSPRFLPIVLEAQLTPGRFEHALDVLIDTEIDLAPLGARFANDATGAPAYDPAVMLKIVLIAYSRGIVSSRAIERLCRENVLFMAISGDSAPRFTTIAAFVRELGDEVTPILTRVLLACDRLGLIGRQMFAIDGVTLPGNADKRRSGTHAELRREAEKMEAAVAGRAPRPGRGRAGRSRPGPGGRPSRAAARVRAFVAANEERRSARGALRKSNLTDNDSAKMATAKGVLQGYTAVAAVDANTQIIVAAQAHGSGSEQSVPLPMVQATTGVRTEQTLVTADAGYRSEENLAQLHAQGVPALIADPLMRRRDERFKDQAKYKALPDALWDKSGAAKSDRGPFKPREFRFDPGTRTCICPAGKQLYSTGSRCSTNGRVHQKFQGAKRDCLPCPLRARCLRHPERTPTRQVAFFAKNQASPLPFSERMKAAIDSARGRALYGPRIATVEPVFANLRHNKRPDRFTLRSRAKVNTQWPLYCLVHNIEKLAHHGYAG
ncbi:MAG: transposase [Pseudomonadota bacterium]